MLNKKIVNKFLNMFNLEMHGIGYMQALRKHSNPPDAFSVQKNIVENAKTIFDIGANYGDTVENYLALYPESIIHAFEPSPEVFGSLTTRYLSNKNVNCYSFAIAEENKKSTFYTNSNPDTNSLLKPQKIGLNSDKQTANIGVIEVESISIDLFCISKNINEIDILKMDIQGGELQALKGAKNLLQNKRIKLIYAETYFKKQYENQPLFHDISLYLSQNGYYLQDVYNPIYGKGSIAWCDAIFLPE